MSMSPSVRARMEAYARELAAAAPPLSERQKERVRDVLAGAPRARPQVAPRHEQESAA